MQELSEKKGSQGAFILLTAYLRKWLGEKIKK